MSPTDLPMMMPKSILVATDLNDLEFLLPEAAAQASATGAMVWLLHVIPPEAESRGNPIVLKEPTSRTAEDTLAKAALELAKRKLPAPMRFADGLSSTRSWNSFGNTRSTA